MGERMKVERRRQKWTLVQADGFRVLFESRFIFAKRRWADRALEWAGVPEDERRMWAKIDVPGSNVVMLVPPPDTDVWKMRPEHIEKARAYQKQLDQILAVPIEEGAGTTCVEDRAAESPKQRKGA